RVKGGTTHEGQPRLVDCAGRGGSRCPVEHRQLAEDHTRPKERQDTVPAGRRYYMHLDETLVDPIAAVAGVAAEKQRLTGIEVDGPGVVEQAGGEVRRQYRLQGVARHRYLPKGSS